MSNFGHRHRRIRFAARKTYRRCWKAFFTDVISGIEYSRHFETTDALPPERLSEFRVRGRSPQDRAVGVDRTVHRLYPPDAGGGCNVQEDDDCHSGHADRTGRSVRLFQKEAAFFRGECPLGESIIAESFPG
ncbi:hypothetical protein [Rhodococcus sp. 27YEA15]|uniref:hypothetical protein n=1 Tax=Rhodococcus sp. 27YEA15 TaxID=3156259 RepID=UPI003C7E73F5